MDAIQFVQETNAKFSKVHNALRLILKEEEELKGIAMVKKGFVIKRYSLQLRLINQANLQKISNEFTAIIAEEAKIQKELKSHLSGLKELERDVMNRGRPKIHVRSMLGYMNNAIYNARMAQVMINDIMQMIRKNDLLHEQKLGEQGMKRFKSLERMTNQILMFSSMLKKISEEVSIFGADEFYPEPRNYGRAMAKREMAATKKTGRLSSSKDPTAVFDCPDRTKHRLILLSKDTRKIFFKEIGVTNATNIVFFRTRLKPINSENPIPQTNGLLEYKFPKGTKIEFLEAA